MKNIISWMLVAMLLVGCAPNNKTYTVVTGNGEYVYHSPDVCEEVVEDTTFGGNDLHYVKCTTVNSTVSHYDVISFTIAEGE